MKYIQYILIDKRTDKVTLRSRFAYKEEGEEGIADTFYSFKDQVRKLALIDPDPHYLEVTALATDTISKCTNCLTEIPIEEFLNNDHLCINCCMLPPWKNEKRCKTCRHIEHEGFFCGQPITQDSSLRCQCGDKE
jgi:hypothetical protein